MFVLAGLTGTVFNVGFFVFGIKLTNAMDAQAIFSTTPIITTIFAILILSEKVRPVQILGVVLGFFGVILIAAKSLFETGTITQSNLLGNLLIFASAVSFAAYILISRRLSKHYEPLAITCISFIVSSFIFGPFALSDLISNPSWPQNVGAAGLFGIFYIGIFASVVAFLSYQTGIKHTSAFTAGIVLYLQPVITTIIASIVLHEKITPPFILGAILIIAGSYIATRFKSKQKAKEIQSELEPT
jgi:drug/metabolite transporter (DMT)-like permease